MEQSSPDEPESPKTAEPFIRKDKFRRSFDKHSYRRLQRTNSATYGSKNNITDLKRLFEKTAADETKNTRDNELITPAQDNQVLNEIVDSEVRKNNNKRDNYLIEGKVDVNDATGACINLPVASSENNEKTQIDAKLKTRREILKFEGLTKNKITEVVEHQDSSTTVIQTKPEVAKKVKPAIPVKYKRGAKVVNKGSEKNVSNKLKEDVNFDKDKDLKKQESKSNEESESFQLRIKPVIEVKPLKNEEIAQRVSNIEKLQSTLRKSLFEDTPTLLRKSLTGNACLIEDSPILPRKNSETFNDSDPNRKDYQNFSEAKNTVLPITTKKDLEGKTNKKPVPPRRNSSEKLLEKNFNKNTESDSIVVENISETKNSLVINEENITDLKRAGNSLTKDTFEESLVLTKNKASSEDSYKKLSEKPSKLPLPIDKSNEPQKHIPEIKPLNTEASQDISTNSHKKSILRKLSNENSELVPAQLSTKTDPSNFIEGDIIYKKTSGKTVEDVIYKKTPVTTVEDVIYKKTPVAPRKTVEDVSIKNSGEETSLERPSTLNLTETTDKLLSEKIIPTDKQIQKTESPVILRKNSGRKHSSTKRVSFSLEVDKIPIPAPRKLLPTNESKTPVEVVTVEVKTVQKESVTPVTLSEDKKRDVNSNEILTLNPIQESDNNDIKHSQVENDKSEGNYQDSISVKKTKKDKELFLSEISTPKIESENNLINTDSARNSRTIFNILSQNNKDSISKSTEFLHKNQSKKINRRSNPFDLKTKSAIISKPKVTKTHSIQLSDFEERFILAREPSVDSIDKIQSALDQFIMDDKKEKKRTNSFKKIFKNFSRKDKDKKKPKKVENEVVEDNAQNESVNRNSLLVGQTLKNPTAETIPQPRKNKELPEIPTEEVEKRYAQMHINRYNQVRANFEQTDPAKFSEDYVCMDNGNKYTYINTSEVNKYIDTSSSSNTLDSENLAFRDSDNSSGLEVKNEAFFETPPRAFDTYQNVQLVKPKANIPINSERPLPLPYQNNSYYGSKHEPEAENANNKNEFSDGVYGTVYDRKLIKTSPDVSISISDRSLSSRSPSLEGSKLKMPINREKVELQPRIRSPIPPSEVSTDKIIATELLKNKKDKRNSPSHQRLEIEIDYPDNSVNRLATTVQQDVNLNPKGKPPISPQSKVLQNLEAGEWHKRQREMNQAPSLEAMEWQKRQPGVEDWTNKQKEGKQMERMSPSIDEWQKRQRERSSPSVEEWQRKQRERMSPSVEEQMSPRIDDNQNKPISEDVWRRQHAEDTMRRKGGMSPSIEDWQRDGVMKNQQNEPKEQLQEVLLRKPDNIQVRKNEEYDRIPINQQYSPKHQAEITSSIYEEKSRRGRNNSLSPTLELKQRQSDDWHRQQEQRKQMSPTPDDWQRKQLNEFVGKQMDLSPKSGQNLIETTPINQPKVNNLAEWQKIHSKQREPPAVDIVEWRSKIAKSPPENYSRVNGNSLYPSQNDSIYVQDKQIRSPNDSMYVQKLQSDKQIRTQNDSIYVQKLQSDRQIRSPPIDHPDYVRKAPPLDQTDYVRRQLVEGSRSDYQKRSPPSDGNSSVYSSNYGGNNNTSNTQLTTNVQVHVDSHSPQNRSVTPISRSTTPVTLRSPSNMSLQRTPPKHEIRQSVEAFCWKELKKMKEQEDIQMQIQLSNYGYLEDPIISHRSRSMSPTHSRNTRRSSSLPREVQRQRRLEDAGITSRTRAEPIYGQRVAYNPNFVRSSPQRNTIGTSTVGNNGQRPIFKRGSLSQNYNTESQALYYKKVGFHSPQNPENPQAWPTKNGYTQSPPQRRLEIKREASLEDEVFLPDKSKEPIYGSKVKEPTREEIFLMNQQRQRQMRELKEPIYDFRPLPNEQFYRQNGQYRNPEREPIYGTRQQIREPIYGSRVMPNISEEGLYGQKPSSYNNRTNNPNLQRNNSFTQRYDYPPNDVRTQEPIYSSKQQEIYGRLGQRVTTVNNKVCDMYGKIHDGQVQKSGVLYGQLQRNTNAPPTQYQSYNQLQNQNFVRGTRLTASVNDMNRYYHQDPRFRPQQQQQQFHEPPDRPLPPIPNDKKFRKLPTNTDTEAEVQRIFQSKNRIAGK